MTNTTFPTKADGARWAYEALLTYRSHFIRPEYQRFEPDELPFAIACLISDLLLLAQRNGVDPKETLRKTQVLFSYDSREEE